MNIIHTKDACDGVHDCQDGSDENNCNESLCKGFWCSNGECLRKHQRCDGKQDCEDGLDEEYCKEISK